MFQPVAWKIQFQNDTVVDEAVNGRCRRHGVLEDTLPFGERKISGDHQAAPFIAFCQEDPVCMITDFEGGILINEFGYGYPVWIYDVSRAQIGYNQRKAKELKDLYRKVHGRVDRGSLPPSPSQSYHIMPIKTNL